MRRRGIDGNVASIVDFNGCWVGEDLEGNDPVLMEILFRLLYGVSEENQDVRIARVPVDIRKQVIPSKNMGNYHCSKLYGVLYFVDRASCNDSW